MTAENLFYFELLAPITGIIALVFAVYLALQVNKYDIGPEKMRDIYMAIRESSKAYLIQQYKTIGIVSAILAVVLYVAFDLQGHNGTPLVSFSFLVGALFSLAAGYVGMDV